MKSLSFYLDCYVVPFDKGKASLTFSFRRWATQHDNNYILLKGNATVGSWGGFSFTSSHEDRFNQKTIVLQVIYYYNPRTYLTAKARTFLNNPFIHCNFLWPLLFYLSEGSGDVMVLSEIRLFIINSCCQLSQNWSHCNKGLSHVKCCHTKWFPCLNDAL